VRERPTDLPDRVETLNHPLPTRAPAESVEVYGWHLYSARTDMDNTRLAA
jgi:hypothetical protein